MQMEKLRAWQAAQEREAAIRPEAKRWIDPALVDRRVISMQHKRLAHQKFARSVFPAAQCFTAPWIACTCEVCLHLYVPTGIQPRPMLQRQQRKNGARQHCALHVPSWPQPSALSWQSARQLSMRMMMKRRCAAHVIQPVAVLHGLWQLTGIPAGCLVARCPKLCPLVRVMHAYTPCRRRSRRCGRELPQSRHAVTLKRQPQLPSGWSSRRHWRRR